MAEYKVCVNFMKFIKYMTKTTVPQAASCLTRELWGKTKQVICKPINSKKKFIF